MDSSKRIHRKAPVLMNNVTSGYISRLIPLYRKRIDNTDISKLDFKGFAALIEVYDSLAALQSKSGMHRESDETRKTIIEILGSKTEAMENEIFEKAEGLGSNIEKFKEIYGALRRKENDRPITTRRIAQDGGAKESAYALIEDGSAINALCREAIAYRRAQILFMIAIGNYNEAFDIALGTVKRYHNAKIYANAPAEKLMTDIIKKGEEISDILYGSGRINAARGLLEAALISAMEMIDIENKLVEAKKRANAAHYMVEFEKHAVLLSARMGDYNSAYNQIEIMVNKHIKDGKPGYAMDILQLGHEIAKLDSDKKDFDSQSMNMYDF